MSEFEYLIDMTKIEKSDMLEVAKGYIKQRGFKAADDVEPKIEQLLMGMEQGNLDRMISTIDAALAKTEQRDAKSMIVRADDF